MRVSRLLVPTFLGVLALACSASAQMQQTFPSYDTIIANQTWILSNATTTPIELWAGAILLTIALILVSFYKGFDLTERGVVSIMAWFSAGFAYTTAFSVDQITAAGVTSFVTNNTVVAIEQHTIYHFDWIAYTCLLPLLILAVLNTIGIYMSWRAIRNVAQLPTEPNSEEDRV